MSFQPIAPISCYLALAAIMFGIGVFGFVIRKNAIVAFMCVELMLNAVNLTFVALTQITGNLHGQISVFFVMVIAAVEAAIGLAIVIALFRNTKSVDTNEAGS